MTELEAEDFAMQVARSFGRTTVDDDWVNAFVRGLRNYSLSEATDALERLYAQGVREYAPNVSHIVAEIREGRIVDARTAAVENHRQSATEGRRLTPRSARDIVNRLTDKRLYELETPFEPDIRPVPPIHGESTIRYMLNGREYVKASPSYSQAYEVNKRNMMQLAEAKRRANPRAAIIVEEQRREILKKCGIE